MISRLHPSFPLFLLILLAVLTFWLDQAVQPIVTTQDNDKQRNPDYIIENLSGIRMDHEHAIRQTFFVKSMLHFQTDNMTYLEQTRFINTEPEKPIIRGRADQAKLSENGEDIYLIGNVTVLRGADEDEGKITMLTDSLHLIPDENIAKTDKPVTISRLNTTINAVGLELNNHTGNITLLSRVKAVDN